MRTQWYSETKDKMTLNETDAKNRGPEMATTCGTTHHDLLRP